MNRKELISSKEFWQETISNAIWHNITSYDSDMSDELANKIVDADFMKYIIELARGAKTLSKPDVIKSVCAQCRFENECRFIAENVEQNCRFFIDKQTVL